jgi:hypothetical protein
VPCRFYRPVMAWLEFRREAAPAMRATAALSPANKKSMDKKSGSRRSRSNDTECARRRQAMKSKFLNWISEQ